MALNGCATHSLLKGADKPDLRSGADSGWKHASAMIATLTVAAFGHGQAPYGWYNSVVALPKASATFPQICVKSGSDADQGLCSIDMQGPIEQ